MAIMASGQSTRKPLKAIDPKKWAEYCARQNAKWESHWSRWEARIRAKIREGDRGRR